MPGAKALESLTPLPVLVIRANFYLNVFSAVSSWLSFLYSSPYVFLFSITMFLGANLYHKIMDGVVLGSKERLPYIERWAQYLLFVRFITVAAAIINNDPLILVARIFFECLMCYGYQFILKDD